MNRLQVNVFERNHPRSEIQIIKSVREISFRRPLRHRHKCYVLCGGEKTAVGINSNGFKTVFIVVVASIYVFM